MLRRLILAALACGLAAQAHAQSPLLKLPVFTQLRSQATESVDISIGSLPLRIAGWAVGHDDDPESVATQALLKGLHGLYIRHYEFATDFAYPQAEVDAVRTQLTGAGWSQLAQVHDQNKNENVDVYLAVDKERITGVAIVASEPREFTIVNAVGTLDLDKVATLRRHLDFNHDHDAAANTRGRLPLL
jgi:Domain of unknown function (DUF4252)